MDANRPEDDSELTATKVHAMRVAWQTHLKRRRSATTHILASIGDTASFKTTPPAEVAPALPHPAATALAGADGAFKGDGKEAKKPAKFVNPWFNDWSQHFVDTRLRPQKFVRQTDLAE
jgi:hypothetical protein